MSNPIRNDTVRRQNTPPQTFAIKSILFAALAACNLFVAHAPALAATWQSDTSVNAVRPVSRDLSKLLSAIPASQINSEHKAKALHALELISQDRLSDASTQMNAALQLDPSNSYLQFFNAFTYHLMGQQGDSSKFGLAEQGYTLSIQFDRSNWLAHYFLGLLHFEQRNFRAAQKELAEVLLSRGDDQDVLFRLVAASYYSGDPITAAACLDRLRLLTPVDPQILRLSAIVSAAIGRADDAQRWLKQYAATNPEERKLTSAKGRVAHWAVVHRNAPAGGTSISPLAKKPDVGNKYEPQLATLPTPAFIKTQMPGAVQPPPAAYATPPQAPASDASGTTADAAPSKEGQRMVLVDVVIMRTEDSISSRKGLNLLSALTLQYGTSSQPGFSKTYNGSTDANGLVNATTTLTRAINLPALAYSLNIANSNSNLNEVLARPTLAALEGVKSDFFSGTTLNAAVVSSGPNSSGAVQIEKEIGVKLSVTPTFIGDNKIKLVVDAQRTFLKPPSPDINFTYKLEVSKIMVNANVVMEFGETLVLGGLSEKETTRVRDGVPVLQDVPGLQYLFSRKDINEFQRSVLMLITPRAPQYTYRSDESLRAEAGGQGDSESLKELRARYGDWFKPYPTLQSVFHHLNLSSIYREFRTGDVTLEKWDKQETVSERLKLALDFLFY